MADLIDDDAFETSLTADDDVIADYHDDDGDEDSVRDEIPEQSKREGKESKLHKKRLRLEAAKARKRQRQEEPTQTANEVATTTVTEETGALSTNEMLQLIQYYRPQYIKQRDQQFSVDDFCFPDLPSSATTPITAPSTGTGRNRHKKRTCPFVKALSAHMPNYRQLLNPTQEEVPDGEDDINGCPLLLIICSSALRATEIIRSLSSRLIKPRISKLFARHFKVEEQMNALRSDYCPIAVGTPHRVSKLIELGALSLRRVQMVLVDMKIDQKKYNILTLKDVREDFYRLLYTHIFMEKKHLKISLIQ